MLVGVFLVLEREVIHCMVLVEAAALDALDDLLPVHVVLPVNDLDDLFFNHYVLALEVNEMRVTWLIAQAELRSLKVPHSRPVF